MHVHKRDVHHFKDLIGGELGQFDDDYSTGKIIEEICLAPKVYANKILFTTKPKQLDKDIYNEYWSTHNDNFMLSTLKNKGLGLKSKLRDGESQVNITFKNFNNGLAREVIIKESIKKGNLEIILRINTDTYFRALLLENVSRASDVRKALFLRVTKS